MTYLEALGILRAMWRNLAVSNKRNLVLLSTFLVSSLVLTSPTQAENTPTMVIMDTALDTSLPEIKNNLVLEVCILEWFVCPNTKNYMEGPGSATLPPIAISSNGFNHGTQMMSIAVRTYPKIKIIFLRIIGNSLSGGRLTTSDRTVYQALEWVLNNKDKYNIVAIGLSQSHHRLLYYTEYCPVSLRTNDIIKKLSNAGVPLFVASGNDNDKDRVSWPGCIPEAMAVSAITNGKISRYSNFDKKLSDYAAIGELRVLDAGGNLTNASGTSVSAQVMAALWTQVRVENPQFSFTDTVNYFEEIAKRVPVGDGFLKWIDGKVVNEEIMRTNLERAGIDIDSLARPRCSQLLIGRGNSASIQTLLRSCRV
jgi:hypothetical protein